MKKILFALAVVFCCINVSLAQTNFIATLQHEGEFTHYYGAGALTSAYNAAVDGDIITLSSGTFSWSGNFDKGLTLRGAGIDAEEKTYIKDYITFRSMDSEKKTEVEGIWFNMTVNVENNSSGLGQGKITFIKNHMNGSQYGGIHSTKAYTYSAECGPQVHLYNCRLYNSVQNREKSTYAQGAYFEEGTAPYFLFINCYVQGVTSYLAEETIGGFYHCMIDMTDNYDSNETYSPKYLTFHDCIIRKYGGYHSFGIPSTSTCQNCVGLDDNGKLFKNIVSGTNNKGNISSSEVFTGDFFQLTNDAKEKYLGSDGTEVGIYGGMYPYNSTVKYPVITKFRSEAQTAKDGSLTIEVEVDGK